MKTKVFSVLAAGLSLALDNSSPTIGNKINFTAEINIPSGEQLPMEYLTLELSGPETGACKFSPDGTIISGCKGITISLNQNSNYGYGYGYGYGYQSGKLIYTITVDTSQYKTGEYSTSFNVKTNPLFTQSGPSFNIIAKQSSGGSGCYTQWQCTDWTECVDGEQFRSCSKKINYCSAAKQPELERTCLNQKSLASVSKNKNSDGKIELNETETLSQSSQKLASAITGAVTGVAGDVGYGGIIIFVVVVLGSLFLIVFLRRVL